MLYVDSLSSLTIDPGVRVHLHRDALIFVDGSLQVNGTLEDPVWFEGDRLEEFYERYSGPVGTDLPHRQQSPQPDHICGDT